MLSRRKCYQFPQMGQQPKPLQVCDPACSPTALCCQWLCSFSQHEFTNMGVPQSQCYARSRRATPTCGWNLGILHKEMLTHIVHVRKECGWRGRLRGFDLRKNLHYLWSPFGSNGHVRWHPPTRRNLLRCLRIRLLPSLCMSMNGACATTMRRAILLESRLHTRSLFDV